MLSKSKKVELAEPGVVVSFRGSDHISGIMSQRRPMPVVHPEFRRECTQTAANRMGEYLTPCLFTHAGVRNSRYLDKTANVVQLTGPYGPVAQFFWCGVCGEQSFCQVGAEVPPNCPNCGAMKSPKDQCEMHHCYGECSLCGPPFAC